MSNSKPVPRLSAGDHFQLLKLPKRRAGVENYTPAIRVHEFSSRGVQARTSVPQLGRAVHTHSYLERYLLLVTLFNGDMVNYQEQYPLERAITLGAAKAYGIRHPVVGKKNRQPLVMTMDALITLVDPATGRTYRQGWDVKPHRLLEDQRVLDKLSLHRAYCHQLHLPHYIFTEQSIPRTVLKNIDWLRASLPAEGELLLIEGLFTHWAQLMAAEVASGRFDGQLVNQYAQSFDARNGLPAGAALRLFKYLAWTREVYIDLAAQRPERCPIDSHRRPEPVRIQTFLNSN